MKRGWMDAFQWALKVLLLVSASAGRMHPGMGRHFKICTKSTLKYNLCERLS